MAGLEQVNTSLNTHTKIKCNFGYMIWFQFYFKYEKPGTETLCVYYNIIYVSYLYLSWVTLLRVFLFEWPRFIILSYYTLFVQKLSACSIWDHYMHISRYPMLMYNNYIVLKKNPAPLPVINRNYAWIQREMF